MSPLVARGLSCYAQVWSPNPAPEARAAQGHFCASHRVAGMVNVKQKRCAAEGCNNRPSFNHLGEPNGIFCSTHKLEGMVRPARLLTTQGMARGLIAQCCSSSILNLQWKVARHSAPWRCNNGALLCTQVPDA